jgi:hypothetical protein
MSPTVWAEAGIGGAHTNQAQATTAATRGAKRLTHITGHDARRGPSVHDLARFLEAPEGLDGRPDLIVDSVADLERPDVRVR